MIVMINLLIDLILLLDTNTWKKNFFGGGGKTERNMEKVH